jgi:ribosomal protein S18 acetylase RimI-like enzyme
MTPTTEEIRRFPRPPQSVTDETGRDIYIGIYNRDQPGIVAMYTEFDDGSRSQGVPPRSESTIREWVETLCADGLNVIAKHNGSPVGHAVLVPTNDSAELAIFVHPEYQSAGIGTQLLKTLLGHGQATGLDHVWLAVSQTNHIAMKLYRTVGFETRLRDRAEYEMERPI